MTNTQQQQLELGRRIRKCSGCSPEYLCAKHEAQFMASVRAQAVQVAATKALAEDTFDRIERSNAAQDAFARKF